jgi:hypothetical protein
LSVLALTVTALAAVAAGVALASSPTGTVTETINVGVRSLTISPTSATMCTPQSPMTFPNGVCDSSPVTITNGLAGGHVEVNGASALPNDGSGNGWVLCGGAGLTCSGGASPNFVPGTNEYEESNANATGGGVSPPFFTTTPACDMAFQAGNAGCVSSPSQVSSELLEITGPTSSSDQSPVFNTTVTWTAAP